MPDVKLPIRRWRLHNFKSIEDADIALSPLTVLVGANSSGKSSILQSILMVAQAAETRRPGPTFPLNGELVQLGEFTDVKSAFAPRAQPIRVGGIFELGVGHADQRFAFAADRDDLNLPRFATWGVDLTQSSDADPGAAAISSLAVELRRGDERRKALFRLDAKRRRIPNDELHRSERVVMNPYQAVRGWGLSHGAALLTPTFWAGKVRRLGQAKAETIEGVSIQGGFPRLYYTRSDEIRELGRLWIDYSIRNAAPVRHEGARTGELQETFEHLVARAVTDIRNWMEQGGGERDTRDFYRLLLGKERTTRPLSPSAWRQIALDPAFLEEVARRLAGSGREVLATDVVPLEANEQIMDLLSEFVSYLGPLRQEPEIVYRTPAPGRPRYLGTRGEFTAPVLQSLRHEKVVVPLPNGGDPQRIDLIQAMNAWLSFLEAATTIESRYRGRLGYEIVVTQPDLSRPVDLTSVGVGVSQVVPVVLLCLLSQPGSVLLLEQPELHLHPAMQQRLGDFFLALARTGRQMVVETHSEYLITRLRRRIAEDASNRTLGLLSIINVTKSRGRTVCDPVAVDELGSVVMWPDGFFDQATYESEKLLVAALEKSRSVRTTRG